MAKTQNPYAKKLRAKARRSAVSKTPKYQIKKGDTVMVIAGRKDRAAKNPENPVSTPRPGVIGKTGIVKHVFPKKGTVLVEGVNLVKKATKPNPMAGQQGGIVEQEVALPISKVMLYDLKTSQPTRTFLKTITDTAGKQTRVRVSVKSKEQIDE